MTVSQSCQPCIPIPPPIMMSEEGTFAHMTLVERLPTIVRRVIEENEFPPEITANLETLLQELPYGIVRAIADDRGPDLAEWAEFTKPFEGSPWIDVPWFFAEIYLYRRILEATHYFLPGQWQGVDPFAPQKRSSLEKVLPSIRTMSSQINAFVNTQEFGDKQRNRTEAIAFLYYALWGNRIDLSLFPGDAGESERSQIETHSEQSNILVDHTPAIADRISTFEQVRVDLVVDNAGFELFCDLCLADFLLNSKAADEVYLHLKAQPLFVSDAMIKDVHQTLEVLAADNDEEVRSLAHRLQDYMDRTCLRLIDHSFWTTPLAFWEMPDELRSELAQSRLIFVKGDANYRRLLGDREWSYTTPFEDIVCYFPAPLAALRTLKAELAAGLQSTQVEELNVKDPNWLTNGQWGVIQFVDVTA